MFDGGFWTVLANSAKGLLTFLGLTIVLTAGDPDLIDGLVAIAKAFGQYLIQ